MPCTASSVRQEEVRVEAMAVGGELCAKKLKVRAVNAVEPAIPQWLRWSEQTITWSRADHPPRVDDPGQLALVVAPQVGGYTLNKVLMDGGSSINILYYNTFKRMQLQDRQLIPTETVFHGIVPGKSAKPIGKIYLEVAFGTMEIGRASCRERVFRAV